MSSVSTQPHRVREIFQKTLAQICFVARDCVEFARIISNLCSKILRNCAKKAGAIARKKAGAIARNFFASL